MARAYDLNRKELADTIFDLEGERTKTVKVVLDASPLPAGSSPLGFEGQTQPEPVCTTRARTDPAAIKSALAQVDPPDNPRRSKVWMDRDVVYDLPQRSQGDVEVEYRLVSGAEFHVEHFGRMHIGLTLDRAIRALAAVAFEGRSGEIRTAVPVAYGNDSYMSNTWLDVDRSFIPQTEFLWKSELWHGRCRALAGDEYVLVEELLMPVELHGGARNDLTVTDPPYSWADVLSLDDEHPGSVQTFIPRSRNTGSNPPALSLGPAAIVDASVLGPGSRAEPRILRRSYRGAPIRRSYLPGTERYGSFQTEPNGPLMLMSPEHPPPEGCSRSTTNASAEDSEVQIVSGAWVVTSSGYEPRVRTQQDAGRISLRRNDPDYGYESAYIVEFSACTIVETERRELGGYRFDASRMRLTADWWLEDSLGNIVIPSAVSLPDSRAVKVSIDGKAVHRDIGLRWSDSGNGIVSMVSDWVHLRPTVPRLELVVRSRESASDRLAFQLANHGAAHFLKRRVSGVFDPRTGPVFGQEVVDRFDLLDLRCR